MKIAASDTLPTWPNLIVTGAGLAVAVAAALTATVGEAEGDAVPAQATSVRTVANAIAESLIIAPPPPWTRRGVYASGRAGPCARCPRRSAAGQPPKERSHRG